MRNITQEFNKSIYGGILTISQYSVQTVVTNFGLREDSYPYKNSIPILRENHPSHLQKPICH
jgi:hypothetical protein